MLLLQVSASVPARTCDTGHIAVVRGTKFAPIFAQQSVRENTRTGRTPPQVMDDAKRVVDAAGWDLPWGADAAHLKTVDDLPSFVEAAYTFFTVDPGGHVDNAAAIFSRLSQIKDEVGWIPPDGCILYPVEDVSAGDVPQKIGFKRQAFLKSAFCFNWSMQVFFPE